ncbi:glycoside hydrolase [Lentzea sp. BCCO 10_0798]|uniref:Glycoside hydrolase n=1 Tax=Lentzea kristufekii TaxID=3095430 RepID=A0ABU4TTS0_9PSEU|nr:glycoside hydrolase [Lentzea sp. BCCO 10_0798]MDX8051698.1 glycoside hydrolase [Lentzea sp. BCCO 10_0798]
MVRLLLALILVATGLATPAAADPLPQNGVTVRVDPSYQQPEFEGWGTSLVWFANITGGYPEPIRRKLVDLLFGEDGLRLNIARYNIGGGNAPDVRKDYMKKGATMEGFWKAPPGTTREDVDWWQPDNPDHWDFSADANQRWWVDQVKRKVTRWEAFSNSPPWFQTVSGYVSGGFDANTDQIRRDRVEDFATYLARVTQEVERAHGIKFDTLAPLNEPNTNYWGTQIGPDGQPTGGRQEGAHAGPELQQEVLLATRRALDELRSRVKVSAMDETNPGTFVRNWNGYGPARDVVDQLNVHTYGTGQRTSVRDIAKGAGEKLWMSEVEGTWGNGTTDYTSMEPGLGMATRMLEDVRELEPSAWVFWQPVEDTAPQAAAGKNWGSIHIPFDCTADDTLESCPIRTNTKFHTIRNFTHFVRPGDRFVKTDDPSSVAAVKRSGLGATVVHVNSGSTGRAVTLDLSRFGLVSPLAKVTPVVTDASGALVRGKPVRVNGKSATLSVPAKSVTTFLVDGVAGVSGDAALVQPDHVYRIAAGGKSLQPSDDWAKAVLRATDTGSARQLWAVRKLGLGNGNRERYEIVSAVTGTRLAASGDAVVLQSARDTATQWIMSTTGDGSWTFVNAATGTLIEATGETVSAKTPTSGANQRWTPVDETVQRVQDAAVFTVPKLRPVLPQTVTPVYPDGARGALPVVWNLPPDWRWQHPGTVRVHGTATDVLGRKLPALAVVTVDTIASTLPARAKTYVGGRPELPATVTGIGKRGGKAELPVVWDAAVFDHVGTVTVTGRAQVVDGSTVAATAVVQVTEPVEVNAALDAAVAATYTESGYSAERLRNGVTEEKAWSNWRSGTKNTSDTITFTLPGLRDLTRVAVHSHRDGEGGIAQSLKVQVRTADGSWVDASGDVEVAGLRTEVVLNPSPPAAAVRVVLTARPSGYLTLGEIEVLAKAPAL